MIINLIRHSTTITNELGLPSGVSDDQPLSETGVKIIEDLKAQNIYPEEPGELYGSPLKRSYQTLEVIYPGKEVHKSPYLLERNFGILERMSKEEFAEYCKDHFPPDNGQESEEELADIPEGGESTLMVIERTRRDFPKLVDEFIEKGYDLVTICGHGAYIRDMAHAFGLPVMGALRGDAFLDNGKGVTLDVKRTEDGLDMNIIGCIGGETVEDVVIDYMKRYK